MDNQVAVSKNGLSANVIKYIAIVAMLIDHIAWCFVDSTSLLGQIMHIIGRITAPVMCYFIAEGYYKTSNLNKYIGRLAIFSVISYFAYTFVHTGHFFALYSFGVILTLMLGLVALAFCKSEDKPLPVKIIITIILCLVSTIGDWAIFGVLYVLAFGLNHNNFKKQLLWFSIVSVSMVALSLLTNIKVWYLNLFHLGVFLAVPLIYFYNGKRGKGGKFNKWVFYIFYPLHLIILGLFKYYI
jgi:hypothetical protein